MLGRYSDDHVMPRVKSFRATERIRVAFESAGIVADEHGPSPISPELAKSAYKAGLLTCVRSIRLSSRPKTSTPSEWRLGRRRTTNRGTLANAESWLRDVASRLGHRSTDVTSNG
jgi:hypothetical protein